MYQTPLRPQEWLNDERVTGNRDEVRHWEEFERKVERKYVMKLRLTMISESTRGQDFKYSKEMEKDLKKCLIPS